MLIIPRDAGEYDEDEHPYTPGQALALGARSGRREGGDLGAAGGEGPDDLRRRGRDVRRRHGRASAVRRAGPGPGPDDAEGEECAARRATRSRSGARGNLANTFLHKSDLIFSIGSSLFPNRFSHAIPNPASKTIVQCTVDLLDINRSYETKYAVIGDAKLTLQALIAELEAQRSGGITERPGLLDAINAGREEFWAKFRPWMESDEQPINPYRVFGGLQEVLDPKNSFVTADSGNTRDQTSTVYQAEIPRGYMGWGNVSTLGFSLAGAIGAKLAFPERQVVNVTGDAGVMYMMGNFEAVARYKIGLTDGPHQQRRLLGVRPRLLGRGPRSVHVQGVGSHRGEHVGDGEGRRLVRRDGLRAVRGGPGPQACAGRERPEPSCLPGVHLLAAPGPRRLGRPVVEIGSGR